MDTIRDEEKIRGEEQVRDEEQIRGENQIRAEEQIRLKQESGGEMIFSGKRLAQVEEAQARESGRNWWRITLFRRSQGGYVLSGAFHIVNEGSRSLHSTQCFASLTELAAFVRDQGQEGPNLAKELFIQAAFHDDDIMALASAQGRGLRTIKAKGRLADTAPA